MKLAFSVFLPLAFRRKALSSKSAASKANPPSCWLPFPRIIDAGPVVAIDPHTAPSVTDPKTEKGSSTFEEFKESLDKAQVTSSVEVHRAYSAEIAKSWNRPIRLLWIDGDHTYQGVQQDFGNYSPFLAPGGIVAFHDCLNTFEGPIRVFTESVLRDNRFGASGFVQSIGWSQLLPAHTHTLSLVSLSLSLSQNNVDFWSAAHHGCFLSSPMASIPAA